MALATLAGLKASALAWIERTGDTAATSIIDDCVTLCEARINKIPALRMSHMETEAELILTSPGTASLPSDFLAMKKVVVNSGSGAGGGFDAGFDESFDIGGVASPSQVLTYVEPNWYAQAYPGTSYDAGCSFYTIIGTKFRSQVSPIGILYYAKIPPLAVNDSNWLLSRAPDVYLYGTIIEILTALEGDAQRYGGLFNAAVEQLIQSETFSRGTVLTMRANGPAP